MALLENLLHIHEFSKVGNPQIMTGTCVLRSYLAFQNMQMIVEAAGGSLGDCLRLVVYVTDTPLFNHLAYSFQVHD